uniref:Uncharacterized protein n=1 Tax=Anguilla anguilla TaxID=7936 RepID=A0A0E9VM18_ANGAN
MSPCVPSVNTLSVRPSSESLSRGIESKKRLSEKLPLFIEPESPTILCLLPLTSNQIVL